MKKFLLTGLALVAAFAMSAQDDNTTIRWKNYTPNGFWDNWEISGGVGANFFVKLGDNENPSFGKLTDFSFNLSVGKWFSPIVGARLQWQGPFAAAIDIDGNYNEFDYMFIHYDQLWNLTNWICGLKCDRLYNAVLTTGFGYARNFTKQNNEYAVSFGLQNRFRLCDAWNLDFELSSMWTKDNFDQDDSPHSVTRGTGFSKLSTSLSAYLGLTYKFPTRCWKPLPQCEEKKDDGAAKRIKDLEKDNDNYKKALKDASDENNRLKKDLENAKKSVPPQSENKSTSVTPRQEHVSFTVFFALNDASLSDEAKITVNTVIDLLKKSDNTDTYTITGFADKDTGNPNGNMELSKRRAETVRKALIKGGIDASRLKTDFKGDVIQPLGSGSINRCVLILKDN
ncbi:MAG: OmpA family protein [Bacteroidales bacterium]|jgi:outer membrane protein OmpA-like peptidoglycan-associated protein|nr:OmpA family protein [Bacteroidales bacterium]